MLEILLLQGEPSKIFKEQAFLFIVMIHCFLIPTILLLGMIPTPTTILGMIRDGKLQWMKSLTLWKNATCELVSLPPERKLIQWKWVYQKNVDADGSYWKYKAWLVEKGFSHVQGVDYTETFAPVAKMDSIQLVLAISASKHWEVHHMDVKSDFIHGDLKE